MLWLYCQRISPIIYYYSIVVDDLYIRNISGKEKERRKKKEDRGYTNLSKAILTIS